jgi:DNA-directed RNA polymerase specialized sigma24 family protein
MIPIFIDANIPSLTRAGKNGKVYFRRKLVSAQIESLRKMDENELLRRVLVRQEEEEGSLKSETLVFLIRCLRRKFASELFQELDNATATTLMERIARILGPLRTHFKEDPNHEDSYKDFLYSVADTFFCKACKTCTDEADYAEVSFGPYIKGLAKNELKKYFNEKKRRAMQYFFEDADELDRAIMGHALRSVDSSYHFQIADFEIPENLSERAGLLKSALNVLPEPTRTAWFLRYAESWEIESRDPSVPSIAKHFKVSGRTISNWLSSAEEKLISWRTTAE